MQPETKIDIEPLRNLMVWFDNTLSAIMVNQARQHKPISFTCGAGCFACCDEPLKVMEGEVDLILADMTPEEKEELKPRVRAWVMAAKANKLSSVAEIGKDDLKSHGKSINTFQYRAMKLTCPLLKDGMCSVYKNRPLGCRMHLAVGPRQFCEDVALRPQQKFMTSPELDMAVVQNMLNAMDQAGYNTIGVTHLGYFLAIKLGLCKEG